MKSLSITLTIVFAMSAVIPATAQTAREKIDGGKKCWIQTDPSRPAGYYGSCKESKSVQAPKSRGRSNPSIPPVGLTIDPRENNASGGGGGGGY